MPSFDAVPSVSRRQFLTGLGATTVGATAAATATLNNAATPDTTPPTIIGHRGCAGLEPPNTVASLERAITLGADGVEIDVQRTKDGELVLFHDPILDWATDGSGPVKWNSLADIREVRLHGEPIPTLEEGLQVIGETEMEIYLELKSEGYTRDVVRAVENADISNPVRYVSFSKEALLPLTTHERPTSRGAIGSVPNPLLIEEGIETGSDIVLSHYIPRSIPWLIEKARENDMEAGIWTLKDFESNIQDALTHDLDVLVTNRPDVALQHRTSR